MRPLLSIVIGTGLVLAGPAPAPAQDAEACVQRKLASFRENTRQPFATDTTLACPAGAPGAPRRSVDLSWSPPAGWGVDPASLALAVPAGSGIGYERPVVTAGEVRVQAWCDPVTGAAGEVTHRVTLTGTAMPEAGPSEQVVSEIRNDCRINPGQ
jgi:hypothetical protein